MYADYLVMRPFNAVFCVVFAAFLLLLIVASCILRRQDVRIRTKVLLIFSAFALIGFFAYKGSLSVDREYDILMAGMGGFNWWGELPLHLCNINMFLIPIAVIWDKRSLMSFAFFVGPLGAMMALIMPGVGFDGYSLILPRMLGYYGTHFAIVVEAFALATFGLYRPRFRDLPRTVLTILAIALAVFGINLLLRATGLYLRANYFYSVETEGNPLLDLFYSWIPAPFLYLLPAIGLLVGYMALVMLAFAGAERIQALRRAKPRPGK